MAGTLQTDYWTVSLTPSTSCVTGEWMSIARRHTMCRDCRRFRPAGSRATLPSEGSKRPFARFAAGAAATAAAQGAGREKRRCTCKETTAEATPGAAATAPGGPWPRHGPAPGSDADAGPSTPDDHLDVAAAHRWRSGRALAAFRPRPAPGRKQRNAGNTSAASPNVDSPPAGAVEEDRRLTAHLRTE